jgi:excisionase family DNA binding protein
VEVGRLSRVGLAAAAAPAESPPSYLIPNRPTGENRGKSMEELKLLECYLRLPVSQRENHFVDTAVAAGITGLSRRTIQWWVEIGLVRAVKIGRRYHIDRNSLMSHLEKTCHDG